MAKKIGAIIPIRLKSERLPGKALMKICGKPVVCHLLDRLFASKYLSMDNVVVCTTTDDSDDELVKVVEEYGAKVFRGSVDDIIKRFYDAIEAFQFDYVIQVDGDDILTDTMYMDLTMQRLLSDDSLDIVLCEGLPLGIASKSFTRTAMQRVNKHYKTINNDTGFTYYFTKTGLCKLSLVHPISPDHILNEARLTLDYELDFEVFSKIFESLYVNGEVFGLAKVVSYLKKHPEVMNSNTSINEEYWNRTREKAQLYYTDFQGQTKKIE